MTSGHDYRRLREVYDLVLDTPAPDRIRVMNEIAAGEPDVYRQLARLLAHSSDPENILDRPIIPLGSSDSLDPLEFPWGTHQEQFGRYTLLEVLGEGGMGVVYRARDSATGQEVALKTLLRMSPDGLLRFKEEFRRVESITHDNLVKLYELINYNGRWCLTMELVQGTTLLDHLAAATEQRRGSRDAVLRALFTQLAEGIVALHSCNVIHRDIKPSNVMVTTQGRVVLLDFGLAAGLDPSGFYKSAADHLIGTMAYLSPEHVIGQPVSIACDWYSAGVLLYEALTGRLPFDGTALAILTAKREREPLPPAEIIADVPPDLNDLCIDLLRREPAARPSDEEVLHRLRAERASAPRRSEHSSAKDTIFVGREEELAALHDAYRTTRNGTAVVVYLKGESGAGKSTLLQQFLDEVVREQPETVVLTGRCYEQESVPFKALDSLLDSVANHLRRLSPPDVQAVLPRDVRSLARLFPVLLNVPAVKQAPAVGGEPSDPQELRRRASGALRELLARLGDRCPLVLAIDDLQWGDIDSASVLTDILLPPDPPVFLGIGCCRSEDIDQSPFFAQLQQLRAGTPSQHDERDLLVGRLGTDEIRDLTRRLLASSQLGVENQKLLESVVRESGGQPFLVRELVAHATAGIASPVLGQDGALTLDEALWRRIRELPEEPRRLLEIVAVVGRPIETTAARQAAALENDGRASVLSLRDKRLLRCLAGDRSGWIEAYHDRVRECVIAHLDTESLRVHHLRLAHTLKRLPRQDDEALARHFHGAGELSTAAEHYARAAHAAAEALAFEHATLLYRRALELKTWNGAERQALYTSLGDALGNAGRGAEAAREYLLAADGTDPVIGLELQRRAAMQLLTSGHVDEGIRRLVPVLRAFGTRLAGAPWRALLSLLFRRAQLRLRGLSFVERQEDTVAPAQLRRIDVGWSAVVGLSVIDPIRGADFQTRNLLLALRTGEPFRIARALAVESGHLASSGALPRAAHVLEEADRLAVRLDRPYALAIVELARGTIAYFSQRWRDAASCAWRAAVIFRQHCTGATWEINTAYAFALWGLTKMGEVTELNRICPGLLKEANDRGDLYAATNLNTQIMALVRMAADEPESARLELERAMTAWSQNGYHVQHHDALLAFVPLELYCGNATEAWSRVEAEWSAFRWSLLSQIQDLRIEMLQLRAYSALALAVVSPQRDHFLSVATKDARRLRRERLQWTSALADYIDGAAAVGRGDMARASALLAAAIGGFDKLEANLLAAATRRRLAATVGGEEGERLQRSANAWFAEQGIRNPDRMIAAYAPGFPS